jgi:EmrB/QacA subfamily drug resistance transporter
MPSSAASAPAQDKPSRIIPLVVASPLFLQNLDQSVMATALPAISNSLQVQVLNLNLAITAYLLSLAVVLPASGWLADRIGARRLFWIAVALFSAASALCGAAVNLPELVLFRVLQGVGGALMVPVARLLLLRTIPQAQLLSAMVWFTLPPGIGRMAGPLFGGAIVTVASWRWIFFVNVPFGLLSVIAALRWIPPDVPAPLHERRRFDYLGFALLAVGLSGVMGSIELVGKPFVSEWFVAGFATLGVLALLSYWRHGRQVGEPLIDFTILRFPTYRISVLGAIPLQMAIGAAPFLLPLLLQLGFGLSALESGLLTVATSIGALSSRLFITQTLRRFGFRWILIGSALVTSLCYAGYGLFNPGTPHPVMFVLMIMQGLTTAMVMVSLNALGYVEIPKPRMSHATTCSAMAQQLGLSLGVVVGAAALTVTAWAHGG